MKDLNKDIKPTTNDMVPRWFTLNLDYHWTNLQLELLVVT